jgi:glycosyltransferase involved in cell wall biosynthesis
MKIALGLRTKEVPWGGGNQFGRVFSRYARANGHTICEDLSSPDIDIIVMTDPRRQSASSIFTDIDIVQYLVSVNQRAVVVHRMNECDASHNTRLRDPRRALANRCADHTVFISRWLHDYFAARQFRFTNPTVIRNGADNALFNANGAVVWDGREPLRIVSHHWSDNWMKGFDIYIELDRLLGQAPFRDLFTFTYIGRLPAGVTLPNTRCFSPLFGEELADALKQNHVYLTAARNEGAGMHHIEGAMCGLPVLYLDSGAVSEYCDGFGVSFRPWTFEASLMYLRDTYSRHKELMPDYPHTAERMYTEYFSLFCDLIARREELIAARAHTRPDPRTLIARAVLLDTISHVALRAQSMRRVGRNVL